MNAFIAQTLPQPAAPAPATHPPVVEGGVLAAAIVFLLKEFVGFFKQKDATEEKLTASLIHDLRMERNQLLQQMTGAMAQISASQRQVAGAIQRMSSAISDINVASQQNARIFSEIFAQLRNQERVLLSLDSKIQSLQSSHHGNAQPGASAQNQSARRIPDQSASSN